MLADLVDRVWLDDRARGKEWTAETVMGTWEAGWESEDRPKQAGTPSLAICALPP